MGYNTALERAINIPNFKTPGTEETFLPIVCDLSQRISIPFFSAQAGATAQQVTFLQVEEILMLEEDLLEGNNALVFEENSMDLTGRQVAIIEDEEGFFFSSIQSGSGVNAQLSENFDYPKASKGAAVFVFYTPEESGNQSFPLRPNELELFSAGCPGLVLGNDLGSPLIIHITNNNDEVVTFHGGTVAYIDR